MGTLSIERRNVVVSALCALISNKFQPSNFSDNGTLHKFVTEYFMNRNEDTDDDVSSDEEEMLMLSLKIIF